MNIGMQNLPVSSASGFGNSLSNTNVSSGVHFDLIASINWWATIVPGKDPVIKLIHP